MEHVDHKHPHDEGGEWRFQEHDASFLVCRLPRLAEELAQSLSAKEESQVEG